MVTSNRYNACMQPFAFKNIHARIFKCKCSIKKMAFYSMVPRSTVFDPEIKIA